MAEPIFPQREMPDFNILGLLLGGRPYASQYFAQKDQLKIADQEQQLRGQFADTLTASPEMRKANENPWDRGGQWALWALAQHGPESAANMGTSYLERMISDTNQRENIGYSDTLEKERINLTAANQIKVKAAEQALEMRKTQQNIDALLGPSNTSPGYTKAQEQLRRNMAYKATVGDLPAGFDVVPTDKGLSFQPTLGGKEWQAMTDEFNATDNVAGLLADLQQQAKDGTGGKGAWDVSRSLLMSEYRKLMKTGTLDQGSLDYFNKLIPDRWDNAWNPAQGDLIGEKLRVLANRNSVTRKQLQDKYIVPADRVANRSMIEGNSKDGQPIRQPTKSEIDRAKALQGDRSKVDAARAEKIKNAKNTPEAQADTRPWWQQVAQPPEPKKKKAKTSPSLWQMFTDPNAEF